MFGVPDEVVIAALAALNVGGITATILSKKMSTKKEVAEAESIAVRTSKEVIELVRDDLLMKVEDNSQLRERNAHLEATQNELGRRIDKLEERERHMLVRAATHEAWDQMAFAKLSAMDGSFPEPPPLTIVSELEHRDKHGRQQIDDQLGADGLPHD
jgi:hypothetical protein